MSAETEIAWKRRGTQQFIDANPYAVILIPTIEIKTAAGGKVSTDGSPRLPQILRLIDQATASGTVPGRFRAQDGQQRRATFMLLGPWDAEMSVGDHWTVDGKRYEITEVLPDNGYEQRGMVTYYG